MSVYLPVSPLLQSLSWLLSNRPSVSGLISLWLLIWRRAVQPPSTTTKSNFTVSLHDTPAYFPKYCKMSSSVSVSSTWKRAGGWVTSPKEKGQSIKGVHHSKVSVLLFMKQMKGRGRRWGWGQGVTEKGGMRGCLFYVCLVIGYQPKVHHGLQSWLTSTECKSIIILFVLHHHVLSLIVP